MHFSVIVHIETKENWEEQVDEIMMEHREHWDWFQIGGRWSGNLSGYNPLEDPANHETCWICNGTGIRNDEIGEKARKEFPEYKCNGCYTFDKDNNPIPQVPGKPGTRIKWPSKWQAKEENEVIAVSEAKETSLFYAIVSEYDWYGTDFWNPNTEKFEAIDKLKYKNFKEALEILGIKTGFLVQVDIHQ